jgi:hypothetical protein
MLLFPFFGGGTFLGDEDDPDDPPDPTWEPGTYNVRAPQNPLYVSSFTGTDVQIVTSALQAATDQKRDLVFPSNRTYDVGSGRISISGKGDLSSSQGGNVIIYGNGSTIKWSGSGHNVDFWIDGTSHLGFHKLHFDGNRAARGSLEAGSYHLFRVHTYCDNITCWECDFKNGCCDNITLRCDSANRSSYSTNLSFYGGTISNAYRLGISLIECIGVHIEGIHLDHNGVNNGWALPAGPIDLEPNDEHYAGRPCVVDVRITNCHLDNGIGSGMTATAAVGEGYEQYVRQPGLPWCTGIELDNCTITNCGGRNDPCGGACSLGAGLVANVNVHDNYFFHNISNPAFPHYFSLAQVNLVAVEGTANINNNRFRLPVSHNGYAINIHFKWLDGVTGGTVMGNRFELGSNAAGGIYRTGSYPPNLTVSGNTTVNIGTSQ